MPGHNVLCAVCGAELWLKSINAVSEFSTDFLPHFLIFNSAQGENLVPGVEEKNGMLVLYPGKEQAQWKI